MTIAQFYQSGFLRIQTWIDNFILQEVTNNANAGIDITVAPMRVEEHEYDELVNSVGAGLPAFVIMPLLVPFARLVYFLLTEKEMKIKETMKIMGLGDAAYYLSWILQYMVVYAIIALLVCLELRITVCIHSNFLTLFIWHFLYGMTYIGTAFLVSAFFDSAKIGIIIGILIWFA